MEQGVVISSYKTYKVFFKIMYICYFGKKKSKKKIGGMRLIGKKQIKSQFSISEFFLFSGLKITEHFRHDACIYYNPHFTDQTVRFTWLTCNREGI